MSNVEVADIRVLGRWLATPLHDVIYQRSASQRRSMGVREHVLCLVERTLTIKIHLKALNVPSSYFFKMEQISNKCYVVFDSLFF